MHPHPQGPYPPTQPPHGYDYFGGPQSQFPAARRASVLMFVMGGLALACGGGSLFVAANWHRIPPEQFQAMKAQGPVPTKGEVMRSGALITPVGVVLLGLGALVRGGRRWAIVASLVVGGLIVLSTALDGLRGVALGVMPAVCASVVMLGVSGLLVYWLWLALREAGGRAAASPNPAQVQYAQYWQQMQATQAGLQGPPPGYGPVGAMGVGVMGLPPPPPPPPGTPGLPPPPDFRAPAVPPTAPPGGPTAGE